MSLGAPLSEEDQATWRQQLRLWRASLQRRGKKTASGVLKARKKILKTPFLSAMDFCFALDNALQGIMGKGLKHWKCESASLRDPTEEWCQHEVPHPVLSMCMDEEQYQWIACMFLQSSGMINIELLNDPVHRRHNDLWHALSVAGLAGHAVLSIIVFNIWYGPWSRSAFFQEAQELAQELLVIGDSSSQCLDVFWDRICDERGWLAADERDSNARKRFLEALPTEAVFNCKGPKIAASKWLSVPAAFRSSRPTWSTKAFGLCLLCLMKGWAVNASDLITPSLKDRPSAIAPHKSVAASKSAGKAKFEQLRQKSENALHAVTRLLCDRSLYEHLELMTALMGPELDEHLNFVRRCKEPKETTELWASLCADGAGFDSLRKTVSQMNDLVLLRRAGFVIPAAREEAQSLLKKATLVGTQLPELHAHSP